MCEPSCKRQKCEEKGEVTSEADSRILEVTTDNFHNIKKIITDSPDFSSFLEVLASEQALSRGSSNPGQLRITPAMERCYRSLLSGSCTSNTLETLQYECERLNETLGLTLIIDFVAISGQYLHSIKQNLDYQGWCSWTLVCALSEFEQFLIEEAERVRRNRTNSAEKMMSVRPAGFGPYGVRSFLAIDKTVDQFSNGGQLYSCCLWWNFDPDTCDWTLTYNGNIHVNDKVVLKEPWQIVLASTDASIPSSTIIAGSDGVSLRIVDVGDALIRFDGETDSQDCVRRFLNEVNKFSSKAQLMKSKLASTCNRSDFILRASGETKSERRWAYREERGNDEDLNPWDLEAISGNLAYVHGTRKLTEDTSLIDLVDQGEQMPGKVFKLTLAVLVEACTRPRALRVANAL